MNRILRIISGTYNNILKYIFVLATLIKSIGLLFIKITVTIIVTKTISEFL
jgi:hypothetical protein